MKSNSKSVYKVLVSIIAIILIVGSVLVIGYFSIKGLEAAGIGNKVKDEFALIVGIEEEHDNLPVGLNLKLRDGENTYLDKTYWSTDTVEMTKLEGQNQELVFHDFTKEVKQYISDSGLFYWVNAAEGWRDHSIAVSTICLNGAIRSSNYYISDSGIYFIGVAEANGEDPSFTSYSGIYHTQILPQV